MMTTETETETPTAAERCAAYRTLLDDRYGGMLRRGSHDPDTDPGAVCVLELVSEARGCERTDDPAVLAMPDLRPLNDARWSSDATRTAHLLPVLAAYDDWREWTESRRREAVRRIALGTVREVLPSALRAAGREEAARQCETVATLSDAAAAAAAAAAGHAADDAAANAVAYAAGDAASAADAAAHAAANAVAYAAEASAHAAADAASAAYAPDAAANASADAAAHAGAAAAADAVLIVACRVWIEAVA